MKIDWNIILNAAIGSIPGILVALGAAYTIFRDRLKVTAEAKKLDEERRKIADERAAIQIESRLAVEKHYEGIAKELKADVASLRELVIRLESRIRHMDDVLEFVFEKVEPVMPEIVATARKMLAQE